MNFLSMRSSFMYSLESVGGQSLEALNPKSFCDGACVDMAMNELVICAGAGQKGTLPRLRHRLTRF